MTWRDVFHRFGADLRSATSMAASLERTQERAQQRLAQMVAANLAKPEIRAYPARREAALRGRKARA